MRSEQMKMMIGPKNWGKTIKTFDHYLKTRNRLIRDNYVTKYARDIEHIANVTTITLLKHGSIFYIVDGQHRLSAMIKMSKTLEWNATVLIPDKSDDVSKLLKQFSESIPQSLSDKLRIYSEQSQWVPIFAEYGLNPAWSGGSRTLTWSGIIRGHAYADVMRHRGKASSSGHAGDGTVAWLASTEDEIRQTAEAMQWWETGATIAKDRGVLTMRSYQSIAFALLTYEENQSHPKLESIPKKIAESPLLLNIKGLTGGRVTELFETLLQAANYRSATHLLTLFGETGR